MFVEQSFPEKPKKNFYKNKIKFSFDGGTKYALDKSQYDASNVAFRIAYKQQLRSFKRFRRYLTLIKNLTSKIASL